MTKALHGHEGTIEDKSGGRGKRRDNARKGQTCITVGWGMMTGWDIRKPKSDQTSEPGSGARDIVGTRETGHNRIC